MPCSRNTKASVAYTRPSLNTHVCTDPNGDEISIDGTIQLCQDLKVDPENVVLLAVAYELKSPRVGEWNKKGWVEGWSRLGSARERSVDSRTNFTAQV